MLLTFQLEELQSLISQEQETQTGLTAGFVTVNHVPTLIIWVWGCKSEVYHPVRHSHENRLQLTPSRASY